MQKLKSVKQSKIKSKKINKTNIKQKRLSLTINFKDMPDLYNNLIKSAKLNFRTPEEHVLYCVWKQTTPEKNA